MGWVRRWMAQSGRKLWPGEQAGAYLSSYFVRGGGRKAPITENVMAGDLPKLVVLGWSPCDSVTGARCATSGTLDASGRGAPATSRGRKSTSEI